MKSKPLSKSTAKGLKKYLDRERLIDKIVDKFEDLIEDTWLDKPYYYCYRQFKWGWWNPRTAYYSVKHGVRNLIKWFPIIWNDRDWDWHYWLEMNIKKLESMDKNIRENGNHVYHIRDADNIRLATLALKRLKEDNYHENSFRNHNKKWGKIETSWGEKDEYNCCEWIMTRGKAVTDKEKEQERKESRRCFKHGDYMQRQDLEFATKIINKYLFHWWD